MAESKTKTKSAEKTEGAGLVDSVTVSKLFGMTPRRVQQLAADRIISSTKVKGTNKYNLTLVAQQYIKYLSDKLAGREDDEQSAALEVERLKAETGLKQAKEQMAKLHVEELKGNMHRSEDVLAMTEDLVFAIRGMLVALPGRLAVDVAGENDPAVASELIRKEVYHIMDELAQYKYDSKKYEERVRERMNWEKVDEETGDDD